MTLCTLRPLTPRQASIWRWIRDYHAEHRHGCCLRDICREFDISSPNGAMANVKTLIRKGWVDWPNAGRYRMAHAIIPSVESMEVTDVEAT